MQNYNSEQVTSVEFQQEKESVNNQEPQLYELSQKISKNVMPNITSEQILRLKEKLNNLNNNVLVLLDELSELKEFNFQQEVAQLTDMLHYYQDQLIEVVNKVKGVISQSFSSKIQLLGDCQWNHVYVEKFSSYINTMLKEINSAQQLSVKCVKCSWKINRNHIRIDYLENQMLLQDIFEKQAQKLKEFAIQKTKLLSCCNKGCEFWVVNTSQDNRSYYCSMCQEMSCRQEFKINNMTQI